MISGTGILRRLGTGITTLTGNNTYSGGTILGGTLILGHDNALGTGTLNMDSSGDPTLQSNNDARSISNAIALGGNGLTVSGANNLALGGVVSGTGSLTKSGTGTLMLSGTNTYTGGTTIDGGTLIASGGNAIGDMGTVAIADATGATLQLDADETIGSLSGGGSTGGEVNLQANTLTAGDAGNTTFAGVISGTGALVKQGTGTLTLSGANTYTGGTTLNGGTLSLANSNALGTGGITVLGSTIDYADGLNIANTIDLQNDATLNVSTGSATQSGDIGETGGSWGIIKTGAGTLILSGTNTYTGGTTINAGTLIASGGNAIGDMGTVAIADVAGATLQLDADETIGSLSGGGTTGGEVNLQANTLTTGDAGNTTFSGVISGTGALTKIGTGTLTLSGTNTYSGGTTLNAGTLIASGGNAIGDMGTVAIADVAGATLQLDADETIGSLSGGGTTGGEVNLQANTLTVGNAGNTTFSGVISGTGALVKQGTGTLTLTGEQQYTGRTAIEQGTLRLAGGADPFVLDFTSTGGTINDAQGEGTGFTQRLDGTFSSTIDAGLDLDTDNARLRITSGGPADFHGELSLGLIEAPGVNLSDLGLGACSDFTIVANFEDAPFPNPHRQYGVYVGDSAYRLIRGGFLTVLTGDIFGVNNSSGTNADTDINYTNVGAPTIGGSVDVILSRIGGVFSLSVNGVDVMPTVQLSELNSLDDLTLGVFSLHTSGTTGAFTVPLTQFSVESPELNSLLPKLHEATAVSIAAGATLDLNGTSQTIASITGDAGSRVLLGNIAGKTFTIAGDDGATRFDGEISGAGHLEKTGNATLTLGGANTYTGGTTLNGGTLSLANSNALGTGGITVLGSTIDYADGLNIANTIDLQNDATLNVSTGSATQSGDIGETGGSWGIIKTGAGTLILSGTNTYTGGTTINAGTLYLGSGGTILGPITLNGGTMQYGSGNATDYSGCFSTAAGQQYNIDTNGQDVTLGCALTSSGGSLTKSGTGTLTLTGTNTYDGGTTVLDGMLVGNTTSLQGDITNNAGVEFDQSDDGTYAGTMSGSGSLSKIGSGTLTLSGTNTYTGGTTLSAGTIILGTDTALGTGRLLLGGDVALQSNDDARSVSNAIATAGNNELTVSGANNLTLGGVIAGIGSLSKLGAGTLTLTGTNTYSGGTTITEGTLLISTDENIGSGDVTLDGGLLGIAGTSLADDNALSTTLIFTENGGGFNIIDSTHTFTCTANLTHAGSLIKEGAGTLALTGTNTYSGGTTISEGTLSISADGQLGSGDLILDGGLLGIAGTSLASDSTLSTTLIFTENGGGFNIIDSTHTFTYTDSLTHAGSLTKAGAGTLRLTGTNTYTGGTTLSGGTLHLGSSSAMGSSGPITLTGGTLQYSSGNTTDYSSRFSTDEGQEYIIDTNGEDITFAGALTSSGGSLTKLGAGTLTLSGNNTYTGTTTLSAGALNLTGQLFGDVVVNGGTFMGTGTLANNGNLTLNSGASFAPGASIGTTTITGNYLQNSGSTLQAEVFMGTDYALSSDVLNVTGTATLQSGSRINVTDLSPVDRFIITGDTFTIITAREGVTDNGAAVTDSSAVLSFAGSVSGNDYILTATRRPFAPDAKSRNSSALLGTIDSDMSSRSFTSDFTLINALSSVSAARLNNAAKQLSPVAHASSFLLSTDMNQHLSSSMGVYLRARRSNMPHLAMPDMLASGGELLFADASSNPALLGSVIRETQKRKQQTERAHKTGYFISPVGTYYTQDATGDIEGFSAKSAGMHFGYDTSLNDHLILGIGGSYSYASIDYDHDLGNADIHSLRAGAYGTYFKDDWFIEGSATLGYHRNSTDRKVQFGGIDRTPTATYDSHELSAYLRTGLDLHYNRWTLTPSTSMHYTYYRSESFQERNAGSAGLRVDAHTQQSLLGKLGLHLHRVSALGDVQVIPEVFVGYAHQFLDEGSLNARFVNGVTKFSTDIDSDRDNSVYYGAGLSVLLSEDVSAFVRYEGESYSGSKTNSVDLGLTMYL